MKFFRSNQRSVECREKLIKLKANALSVSTTDITTTLEDSVQSANQALEVLKIPNSLDAETETTVTNLLNLTDNLQSICTSVKTEIEKKIDMGKRDTETVYVECGPARPRLTFNSGEINIHFVLYILCFTAVYVSLYNYIFLYRPARSILRTPYIILHEIELRQIEHTA
ncbi:hypothetical protein DPMN_072748 [Dreissena polymorpha]|uniref:Uncharacterized protein n=1 Tax=Dreissena polymorpha TaxID=45954 RepID=A0A9D4BXU4_DREPO|nr:hypothetical protein DPMN_072748 [Dreissena polymorpha]